eukprot:366167-Chlamydomonas_euryale.AAC.6
MDQTGSTRSYPTSTTARCRKDRKAQAPEKDMFARTRRTGANQCASVEEVNGGGGARSSRAAFRAGARGVPGLPRAGVPFNRCDGRVSDAAPRRSVAPPVAWQQLPHTFYSLFRSPPPDPTRHTTEAALPLPIQKAG